MVLFSDSLRKLTCFDLIWSSLLWFGFTKFALVWFYQVCFGLVCLGNFTFWKDSRFYLKPFFTSMLKCDNFLKSSQTGIRTKEDTVVYSDEDVVKNVHQDFVIVFGVTFVIIISIIVVVFCLSKLTVRVLQNRQHIKVNWRTKLTLCNYTCPAEIKRELWLFRWFDRLHRCCVRKWC